MIDLHTHTNLSDGTLSPRDLVDEAARIGLEALAITDHDTFAGYDHATEPAARCSIELVCGLELSARYAGRSVHVLGYFLNHPPPESFRRWVGNLEASRIRRNKTLVRRLAAEGLHITLDEVSARAGGVIARPHFAALMVEKGYVPSIQSAFDRYLGESGTCFVPRDEPEFEECVSAITGAGGLAVLPHPGRFSGVPEVLERELVRMRRFGLRGIEVYHSDHRAHDVEYYLKVASSLDLAVTGGSDFHGAAKPEVSLGSGLNGNVRVPRLVLDELRRIGAARE